MRTFNTYFEAFEFSLENPSTLVKCSGCILKCYYFNGDCHGVDIQYNRDGSVQYRDFNIQGSAIDIGSLSEIQLQSIFGECYENI